MCKGGVSRLPSAVMQGQEFVDKYGFHGDLVTSIQPTRTYLVKKPAEHPVLENFRVHAFREVRCLTSSLSPFPRVPPYSMWHDDKAAAFLQVMLSPKSASQLEVLGGRVNMQLLVSILLKGILIKPTLCHVGELMSQSHASYGALGLGSSGTDLLCSLVSKRCVSGVDKKGAKTLYGAKITGGGSGGTVCILGASCGYCDSDVEEVQRAYRSETGYDPTVFRGSSMGALEFGHLRIRRWGDVRNAFAI